MGSYTISVIHGDGIGPEVGVEGVRILQAIGDRYGHRFAFTEYLAGGAALDRFGVPLPDDTLRGVKDSAALLFGAIGGPKWEKLAHHLKPEAGLLALRQGLGAFANLRPAVVYEELIDASTIKPEVLRGTDIMVVRELTGGIYFGAKTRDAHQATDLCTYTAPEIERIVRVAARIARTRRRRLLSIDKSNVLETSRLWREVCERVMHNEFPDVQLEHMLVDSAAMHLIRRPRDID